MKVNGIDVDDIDFLKDQVRDKYGSLRTFTAKTSLPYRRTLNLFNRLEFSEAFYINVKRKFYETKHVEETFGRISKVDRELIRVCIMTNFKSVTAFCKKNRRFDNVYISNIISGRLKLVTPKYRKLILALEKKYNLKIK